MKKNYQEKYLKYKQKYVNLSGGASFLPKFFCRERDYLEYKTEKAAYLVYKTEKAAYLEYKTEKEKERLKFEKEKEKERLKFEKEKEKERKLLRSESGAQVSEKLALPKELYNLLSHDHNTPITLKYFEVIKANTNTTYYYKFNDEIKELGSFLKVYSNGRVRVFEFKNEKIFEIDGDPNNIQIYVTNGLDALLASLNN